MKYKPIAMIVLTFFSQVILAKSETNAKAQIAQPTACIKAEFTDTGDNYWKTISLKLTNTCAVPADLQNAIVTFHNTSDLNTSFWGGFTPLSYPDNVLQITSQQESDNNFLSTLNLHFPNYNGNDNILPNGQSITIQYGNEKATWIQGSVNVYLGSSIGTGNIELTNSTTKPKNVSQSYALVHITANGQNVSDVHVPWGGRQKVTGIAVGTYEVAPERVKGSDGNTYQGKATPQTISLAKGKTVTSTITYKLTQQEGNIGIKLPVLPAELNGYTSQPAVLLTELGTGSTVSANLNWNTTSTVSKLKKSSSYSFSTPSINYNGYACKPLFAPTMLTAAAIAPVSSLTYTCKQMAQSAVTINVADAPSSISSLAVTLTPNDGSAKINETIDIVNGKGSITDNLTNGVIYILSTPPVSGYDITFSPQPLTVAMNANATITFKQQQGFSGGRVIGYLPGWKNPPSASALASAGYTHVIVAFGVFSTSNPGEIVPVFDTVTKEYIQSLQQAGIKVLLSLGGASSSAPDSSVDFHQVLTLASSPDTFKQTFIASLQNLMMQYGFDGFDIDIEHGLNAGGSFANPQGDIAILASIINTVHSQSPTLLISMAPQVANISATSGFDQTWGNYASLIMQTHDSLSWVGIQLYNTGCAYGVDKVCYDVNLINSPDFSVAMAVDLLANWPTTLPNGQISGFQPYLSYLNPSQVVLGYPSANASGASDGAPATPTSTIKRAIQCLKTAVAGNKSCGVYIPPKAYGNIGGVFNWEVTYDQNNSFKFATDLKPCVINGNCN